MQKLFSICVVVICLSLLALAITVVLQYYREQSFSEWYNGPKLVTAWIDTHVTRSGSGPTSDHIRREEIENEFKKGCELYHGSQYRDFTYRDCREELESLFLSKRIGNTFADKTTKDLTRKLIAMMRLNGERGHQLVYLYTLETEEPWLYQLWDTYEILFGMDTLQSFLVSTKLHQLELLDAITARRINPDEFLAWRINTYFATHEWELAEIRSRLLIFALSCILPEQETTKEAVKHAECALYYYRTQHSHVQEYPVNNLDSED